MNAKEVLEFARENNVVMVDLRFTDWPGTWQHCSFPINEIAEEHFEDGLGFDGSSIRGWQSIHESDMLMIPDSTTAFIDPFYKHPTLVILSDIVDPIGQAVDAYRHCAAQIKTGIEHQVAQLQAELRELSVTSWK